MVGFWLGLALMAGVQQGGPGPDGPPPPPPPGGPRPPHGRLFISPMGEPFRGEDPIGAWFAGADANHDGVVTEAEFIADADRVFLLLDREHDGEIDPQDIDYYETVLVPEIRYGGGEPGEPGGPGGGGGRRGGGRGGGGGGGPDSEGGPPPGGGGGHGGRRGGGAPEGGGESGKSGPAYDDVARGAARFGFFAYPEPITAADANLNRGVDITEFRKAAAERFAMLDKKGDGRLTREELPKLSPPPGRGGRQGWYGGKRRTAGGGPEPVEQAPPEQ
ncbi:EF-hand domain-containing protein [Sphingomonas sp. TF3]|uniref:EF-hand domain-containing protein n=1 Tax=Sphingomonas sp. TF3 TaxID=2495580 RepID=UPI000F85E436|nr:EF-hand domain-containing protein [Sphingomonas sp. TF3]RUN77964.1 EF-hand domain-containing protein [Sphingomonas sp. TF3]